jgi:hypothetical protein
MLLIYYDEVIDMAKNAKAPAVKKLQPFEKLLTLLVSGEVVTKQEIDQKLGNEIYLYRISTYIWHVKKFAGGIVKSIKDGRVVVGYQITNPETVRKYMAANNVTAAGVGVKIRKPSVAKAAKVSALPPVKKLQDLQPVQAVVEEVVADEIEVTELVD